MDTTDDKLREYLKLVTAELQKTRKRLHEVESAEEDPVAIVGMTCRYPGEVRSSRDLWDLVESGRDAIGELPDDRGWDLDGLYSSDPLLSGSSYVRAGGFLYDAADFDPGLFGISPHEALAMDPQQRLLLESSWELFERAGFDPRDMRGRDAGVFVGAAPQYYAPRHGDPAGDEHDGYLAVGNTTSVLSGRIAYTFGLTGPALSADTACSASLTSLHLAVRALREGECSMAIAGGVTIMSSPDWIVGLSRQRGLSSDGRCKAFSAAADGFGIAEGVGLLLLEPLSVARRDGHEVLAVVRGSAMNQDGASNGLTAPNEEAQVDVIRRALRDARLSASEIDVVEAHGTGTALGDPIEANALAEVYGAERPADRPLFVGSLKSNIGHTQAAAGVGGVIKMIESMRHGRMPATLHAETPSPHVDWASSGIALLTTARAWESSTNRRVGVSAFGISGTNVHVVLEQAPAIEDAPDNSAIAASPLDNVDGVPLLVSANTRQALSRQCDALADHLRDSDLELADVATALIRTRARLPHRAVVFASDLEHASTRLRALASGADADETVAGTGVGDVGGRVAFVFPGQGGQWLGMGAELARSSVAFATRLEECTAALRSCTDVSTVEALVHGHGGDDVLENVEAVQCASWAVMVSLVEAWKSVGVEPSAVIGHSQGEIAAAAVSGALSLEDAARVVALRSRMVAEKLAGRGGMAAIALPADEVEELIAPWQGEVSLAARNGPSSTVVSGDLAPVREVVSNCSRSNVDARMIAVDYASHSKQIDEIATALRQALRDITPRAAQVPFYSTVTGSTLDGAELDGDYWFRNLRHTVRFEDAVRAMLADGFGFFIESSAHPVLEMAMEQVFDAANAETVAVGTLRRNEGTAARFLMSVAEGHVRGLPDAKWSTLCGERSTAHVSLPTYAFERTRYWISPTAHFGGAIPPEIESQEDEEIGALGERLRGLSQEEQEAELLGLVQTVAARILRYTDSRDVTRNRAFRDMGFDSLAAMKLRNHLQAITGLRLPATVVFAHPTPAALAHFLLREIADPGDRSKRQVLDELDRLDTRLGGLALETSDREQIGKRLEALLRKWSGDDIGGDSGHITETTLDSASDEEMFALIDERFGARDN